MADNDCLRTIIAPLQSNIVPPFFTIILILTVISKTVLASDYPESSPIEDESSLEDIVEKSFSGSVFLDSVEANVSGCVVQVRSLFNRTCGTDFDDSKAVERNVEFDLTFFEPPILGSIRSRGVDERAIIWAMPRLGVYETSGTRVSNETRMCSGRVSSTDQYSFSITEADEIDIGKVFEFVRKYQRDFCS